MEPMVDFFTERVKLYDRHMLEEVEGCKEGYRRMAQLLPQDCQSLLDLGCGTGLELDEIFKRCPQLRVTGIDLTQAMLEERLDRELRELLGETGQVVSQTYSAVQRSGALRVTLTAECREELGRFVPAG